MQKELLKRVEMAFDEFSSALVCGISIFFCFYFHLSVLRLYKFILFYIFFHFYAKINGNKVWDIEAKDQL